MQFRVDNGAGFTRFSPVGTERAHVLMVPYATDPALINTVLELGENQHHAWGVKELLEAGNVVTVLDPPAGGRLSILQHDFRHRKFADVDLIYCNHNVLVRSAVEHLIRRPTPPIVSLVYAGERLIAPRRHHGILAMTPVAHRRFEGVSGVEVGYTPWGVDPDSALHEPVAPDAPVGDSFVSSGITGRDFSTLFSAARLTDAPVTMFARGRQFDEAPSNVSVARDNVLPWDVRAASQQAVAGLVILERDDVKRNAVGWTNLLDLMAMGVAVIKTRTGALDDIVDIEQIGAGLMIPAEDPTALASAMDQLRADPDRCREMGSKGAAYVREHLTMERFAQPLLDMVDSAARS